VSRRLRQPAWALAADTLTQQVEYVPAFFTRALPESRPTTREAAAQAFDEVWQAFDREYAMFVLKPQVDWSGLREEYRPRAQAARTEYDLAAVLAEMLRRLEDLHVSVRLGPEWLPGYTRPRPLNASWAAVERTVSALQKSHADLVWARTSDGVGYVNVRRLNGEEPRWLDLDPFGTPLDGRGVQPAIRIDAKPEDFTPERDPVLEAALTHLRKQPQAERKPARRQ